MSELVAKPAPQVEAIVERANPLGLPDVGVSYRNLNYGIMLTAAQSSREVESVYTKYWELLTLPYQIVKRIVQSASGNSTQSEFKILQDVDGHLEPGKMTLILSPPGHGKSSFLKAIASQNPKSPLNTGEVRYGGLTAAEAEAQGIHIGHLVQYVEQLDQHLPFLTVRETFDFIHSNALVNPADYGHTELGQQHASRVDDTLKLLSLGNCAETVVGNDLLRGISGGEKKRVTVGESLLTNARVLLMDEISTGLDASVTFDICHSLRRRAQQDNVAVVIALLQPTPEVYSLFDDVILMREGQVVYHGPRTELPQYLKNLGFDVPSENRSSQAHVDEASLDQKVVKGKGAAHEEQGADMADFLSEWLFMPHKGLPAAGLRDNDKVPPLTTTELVHEWKANPLYKQQLNAVDAPLELKSDFAKAQYGKPYVHSTSSHVGMLVKRQFILMSRNKVFLTMRAFTACFMAIVFGGMYYQKSTTVQSDVLARYGLFLNSLMQLSFANMSEMASAVEFKYTAYKHCAASTFPRFAYVLAAQIAHIPVALIESLIFCSILYWMAGLAPYASNWIFYVLLGFLADLFMGAMFRAFAYAAPTLQAAQSAPMPILSILIVFAGFMITRSHMGWTIIFFYIDIYGWLYRAMAQNEFLSPSFAFMASQAPNSTTPAVPMGNIYLKMFDMETDPMWMGYGVLHGVCSIAVAIALSFLAFAYVKYDRNVGSARRVVEPDDDLIKRLGSHGGAKAGQEVAVELKATGASAPKATPQATGALVDALTKKVDARSVLPFEPMSVVFEDIKYTVTLPEGKQKCLLQGVSGFAVPGRMIALMGASGAGKTTLLDVLASRKNSGVQEGRVLLNGHLKNEDSFSRITAYVEQMDIHMPLTTVREALQFSAAMRLPNEVTEAQRESFIDEVLQLLELTDIQTRKVGDIGAADALAPGERKRLTIAVELVSNAPVIFLDEPTSGLDARAAAVVMRVIKNVANTGRTVICTIHQPSSDLFFMFDDLLLLQKGGFMVYFGPVGENGVALIEFLQGMDGVRPCPNGFNPASWMLDVLAGTDSSIGADDASSRERASTHAIAAAEAEAPPKPEGEGMGGLPGPMLMQRLLDSDQWKASSVVLSRLSIPAEGSKPVTFASKQARTWPEQFIMLLQRTQRSYSRNVGLNFGRFAALLGLMLLFGIIYLNTFSQATEISGVSSVVACIFMTATFSGMLNMQASIPDLIKNRATFYREQSSYMYDSNAYTLANIVVELPWLAFIVLGTLPVIYFMLGLSLNAGTFFSHYVVTFAQSAVFVSLGHALAAAMPSFEVAMAAAGAVAPLCFLFGGLFAPVSTLPPGTRWVSTIDPVYYTFQALIPLHFWCDNTVPGATCPTVQVPSTGVAGGLSAMDRYSYVSNTYAVSYPDRWTNFGYIWVFVGIIQVLVIYNVRYKRYIVR